MSVEVDFYLIMGIKLTNEQEKLIPDELYDSNCLLIDGMCGKYCYLGFIVGIENEEFEITGEFLGSLEEEYGKDIERIYDILGLDYSSFIEDSKLYLVKHYY
jgi:hypothetical protein